MASMGDLQNNFNKLAKIEQPLWDAFKTAERDAALPTINLRRLHSYSWPLYKNNKIQWHFYPLLPITTLIMSYLLFIWFLPSSMLQDHESIIWSACSLILIVISARWGRAAYRAFREAYTQSKLNHSDFVISAFGLNNSSLLIYYFLKAIKENDIKKDDVGSIIKVIKSKQEFQDVSIGLSDHLKKLIFGAVVSLPIAYFSNKELVNSFFDRVYNSGSILVQGYMIYAAIFLIYIAYDLIFSTAKQKKQKRRYLLVLNLIHESWAK